MQPAGTGEPAFTNSTQNTQWLEWPASSGVDAYRIRFDYYENNTLRTSPTYPMSNGGSSWANWSGVATLQHGGQYGICAQGQYSFPNDSLFFPDGPNSCSMGTTLGRRAYTTIDRSKPTAGLQLAEGAAFVSNTKIPVRIDFADDVAGPFPANFVCFQVGGGPCDTGAGAIYGYNAACSVPGSAGKATTFSCTADYGEIADGGVWACVIAADASIPDNPNGPDQRASAERANLSAPSCDGVVVDRTAPTASIGVALTTVKVGQLVAFQASSADATSGLAGAGGWTWGDNTAGATGDAVTHTYTRPGTYEVSLTVTDAAGNQAKAKKTVTVTAATTPPPADGGGSTTPPPAGGGTTTPPEDGGDTDTPPVGDDGAEPPSLDLDAPRRARARAKSIPVELTASDSGRVRLSLTKGRRVIARTTVRLDPDGTADYRLKLPKGTKAGRYTLTASYGTITASRSLTLTGKRSARRARASVATPKVGPGPRALPDGRFHGPRPQRTFAVTR
ncbi:MAG TPA: PKD domain-containing protein [Solirubrobacter sp.]|nr:PKD domain-containing protein [Solirubrobacter sp.]